MAAAQRVAAARETAAAAAIQRSAADTAAELRKQDVDKQITQSEREARVSVLLFYFYHILDLDLMEKEILFYNTID